MTLYHEHFLRSFRYSMKSLWLLIFPIIRGVSAFSFNPEGFYAWAKGAWMDIVVFGIIFLYGLVRWYCSRITLTDDTITHTQGIFFKVIRTIPFDKISSASTETLFFLFPLRATVVCCDTRAGFFKSTDMKILVSRDVANRIMSHIPNVKHEKRIKDIPVPTFRSVLLFAFFFSSGLSGVVYLATFFFKGGDMAHDIIGMSLDRINRTTDRISETTLLRIPRTAILVGILFIVAWLFSFTMNVVKYYKFKMTADGQYISIACGLVKRRRYRIKADHINYTDLRQNLLMKLLRAVTINISCPGYGLDSNLPVLLSINKKQRIDKGMEVFGVHTLGTPQYKPCWSSFFSYEGLPAAAAVVVYVLSQYAIERIPFLDKYLDFPLIMLEIPLLWFTAVKTVAHRTSGISIYSKDIMIWCSKGTAFHTVVAKRKNIVKVEIRQTITQIPWKTCDMVIWFRGESRSKYNVKSMNLKDAREIAEKLHHDILV